jgi:hypothetical protein
MGRFVWVLVGACAASAACVVVKVEEGPTRARWTPLRMPCVMLSGLMQGGRLRLCRRRWTTWQDKEVGRSPSPRPIGPARDDWRGR